MQEKTKRTLGSRTKLGLFDTQMARSSTKAGAWDGIGIETVSYTHLTLPTNREV